MSTWNHRVVQTECDGEFYYAIHECYYENPGDAVPNAWTENPVHVGAASVDGIKWVLDMMAGALAKPALRFNGTKIVEVAQ